MKQLILFLLPFLIIANCFSQDSTTSVIRKVTIKKNYTEADLFPRLCGKLIGDINFKEIELNPVLKTRAKLKIESFKMSLRVGSGELIYLSDNQRLTTEMLEAIANLKSGEPILFYDIKALHYSGKLVQLQPLELIYR